MESATIWTDVQDTANFLGVKLERYANGNWREFHDEYVAVKVALNKLGQKLEVLYGNRNENVPSGG